MQRRRFLAGASLVASAGLAGCTTRIGGTPGSEESVEYQLQSDRIYRGTPVRTAAGLVLTFTYAMGDTGYRFQAGAGTEMLFPANGWFLKTSVDWLWEAEIPDEWQLDPSAFQLVVNGEHYDPMAELPRGLAWEAVSGEPAQIPPHFAGGVFPTASARQGRANFLFDVPADLSVTYYLRWMPQAPVDGSTDPVFLTSTWGPFDRSEAVAAADA